MANTSILDHMGIVVADYAAGKAFYEAALAPLGIRKTMELPPHVGQGCGFGRGAPQLWLSPGGPAKPHLHVAFTANGRAEVDAFYKAALAAGGKDNGAPGIRAHYHANYYAAFVHDLDGNNIEAVCHAPE